MSTTEPRETDPITIAAKAINSYLDEIGDDDLDAWDLAENVVVSLRQHGVLGPS
ncbi:hypothetical protein ABT160_07635 [Streptomyces sp. NPDC001941]|uniref:hypothetical protein n=1 Tax=Streptomyces sp. NPDC001941 TaxID=3154659 RepID=UPI00331B5053